MPFRGTKLYIALKPLNTKVSMCHSASHSASVNLRKMVGLLSERPIFKTEIEGVTELKVNESPPFFSINKRGGHSFGETLVTNCQSMS